MIKNKGSEEIYLHSQHNHKKYQTVRLHYIINHVINIIIIDSTI